MKDIFKTIVEQEANKLKIGNKENSVNSTASQKDCVTIMEAKKDNSKNNFTGVAVEESHSNWSSLSKYIINMANFVKWAKQYGQMMDY